ncbi:MAG: 8-oxo-dGTP diphosphatase [Cryomorphaceae bacterium]|jgi:8-oxo-dGTP diphosphatase
MTHTYKYPRAAVSVDCVIIGHSPQGEHLLLIERKNPPFQGKWALPGGFHDPGETVEQAAARELKEETSLTGIQLKQIGVFSQPDRDPREQVISIAHQGEVVMAEVTPIANDDANKAEWFPLDELPPLAFDHLEIIRMVTINML